MIETRNVKLVAYLRMKGIFPDSVQKISRGKAKYLFNLSEAKWTELHTEFDRSEFITYAQCMDAVVDLAH